MNDDSSVVMDVLGATAALTQELDATAVLHRVVETARRLVGARYAALGVREADGRSLADFIYAGITAEEAEQIGDLPTGGGVLGLLLSHPEPVRMPDLTQHPSSVGFPQNHPLMNSFIGVPVVNKGQILGNLYLTEKDDGQPFTEADTNLLTAFASQAAVVIENARLYDEAARQARQGQVLVGAIESLVRRTDPMEVIDAVVDAARDLTDAEYAAVGIFDQNGALATFIQRGIDESTAAAIGHPPQGLGLLKALQVEGRPMRLDDLRDHPASSGVPDGHPVLTSFLGAPIPTDSGVEGHIYLANKRSGTFNDSDEELIVALAGQAGVALERSATQQREADTVVRLQRLLDANLALTRNLDPVAILQEIVDLARDLIGAEYAALGVLSEDGQILEGFIYSGISEELAEQIGPLPRGLGVLRSIMIGKRPMRLHRLADHPASVGFPDNHPAMDSFLGVPLTYQGQTLGNLYLTNKVGADVFDDADEALANSLAAQAAVAIQNAKVYARERRAQQDLESVNQQLERFAYVASHDLREPLRMITAFLGKLDSRYADSLDDRARTYIHEAVGGAERLKHLLDALLNFSQVQRKAVSMQAVDLSLIVKQAVSDLRVGLDEAGAEVLGADALPTVRGDEALLTIVVQNLIRNAVKFSSDGQSPRIELDARRTGPRWTIGVEDNGIGIAPQYRHRVFRMFERLHSRSEFGGTGIGLTTVQTCLERMNGEIAVVDPHHGTGARIEFTLDASMEEST